MTDDSGENWGPLSFSRFGTARLPRESQKGNYFLHSHLSIILDLPEVVHNGEYDEAEDADDVRGGPVSRGNVRPATADVAFHSDGQGCVDASREGNLRHRN